MSAIGPKRTSLAAPHMSAFGGKADMVGALHMSALTLRDILLQSYNFVAFGTKRTFEDFGFLPHI
jgi:hypothetical protein